MSMSLALEAPTALPMVILRPYQEGAIVRLNRVLGGGVRRALIVAPTGSGKTVIAARIITDVVAAGGSVMLVAHRRELIDQGYQKCLDAGIPRSDLGVVMASDPRRNPGAHVQIASIDTLRGWIGNRALPLAHVVIIDEAHRAAAQSYVSLIEAYPDAAVLGLTATPWRLDGRGLGDLFDDMVVVSTIRELTDGGFLVPLRCFSHPTRPDLSKVKVRAGEFAEEEVSQLMRSSLLLGSIPEQYRARAEGRAAFGFACNVAHAIELAEVCNAAGIPSVAVSAESEDGERARALAELRSGSVKVVWNVGLFTEGTDVPEVKAIILARPTLSKSLVFQMIGRGHRPAAHTGFSDCVVLDHAGVLQIHGHPLDPQDYSLTTTRPKRAGGAAMVKECPACGELVSLGATLCACGYAWERDERTPPPQVAGNLVEHAPKPPVILPAAIEEKFIRAAFKRAMDHGAGNPLAYARAILERQLKRPPNAAILDRVVASMSRGEKAPAPKNPMPDWIKAGLGLPTAPKPLPQEPAPAPFQTTEPIGRVEF